MQEEKKNESTPLPAYQGRTKLVKKSVTIEGSIIAGLVTALIISFAGYMVTVNVNESKIEDMTYLVKRVQNSLDWIEQNQDKNTITLTGNKTHIENLEKSFVELKNTLRENKTELNTSLRKNKTELNNSLRNIKSRLNKLILALVSNPKIKLDYEKFTPFSALDGLDIDDLKKMAKEINKTQKIVSNEKISPYEKAVIVNKFFDGISDIYKTGKYNRGVIAERVFNVKIGVGGSSDENGMGGGTDPEIE